MNCLHYHQISPVELSRKVHHRAFPFPQRSASMLIWRTLGRNVTALSDDDGGVENNAGRTGCGAGMESGRSCDAPSLLSLSGKRACFNDCLRRLTSGVSRVSASAAAMAPMQDSTFAVPHRRSCASCLARHMRFDPMPHRPERLTCQTSVSVIFEIFKHNTRDGCLSWASELTQVLAKRCVLSCCSQMSTNTDRHICVHLCVYIYVYVYV